MRTVKIQWPDLPNEHGGRMLWFGSWLAAGDDVEAGWFYSGRGGERGEYRVPQDAIGLRVRRWPGEGLDPEYADLFDLADSTEIRADSLTFDSPQMFSRMRHIRAG